LGMTSKVSLWEQIPEEPKLFFSRSLAVVAIGKITIYGTGTERQKNILFGNHHLPSQLKEFIVKPNTEQYEWDYLTLMNDEEVDYETLPEEVLTELALGGEWYMATSAVTELSIRQSEAVIPITWQILSKSLGDQYLQAAALSALFEAQREKALAYMLNHAATCEPYLLNTIKALTSWHHLEPRFDVMISKIKQLINERASSQNGHHNSPSQATLMPYLGAQDATGSRRSAQELDWLISSTREPQLVG
ncbi:MAG: hypothetical protein ACPGWR_32195, partial [Ardenticatenaceae bacterium]